MNEEPISVTETSKGMFAHWYTLDITSWEAKKLLREEGFEIERSWNDQDEPGLKHAKISQGGA